MTLSGPVDFLQWRIQLRSKVAELDHPRYTTEHLPCSQLSACDPAIGRPRFSTGHGPAGTASLPSQCTNGDRSFAQVASVVACAMLKDRTMFDPGLTGKTMQREEPGKEEMPELPVNPELVRSTLK